MSAMGVGQSVLGADPSQIISGKRQISLEMAGLNISAGTLTLIKGQWTEGYLHYDLGSARNFTQLDVQIAACPATLRLALALWNNTASGTGFSSAFVTHATPNSVLSVARAAFLGAADLNSVDSLRIFLLPDSATAGNFEFTGIDMVVA